MSDAFCVTSRLPLRICIFPSFPTAFIMKSDAFIPPFKVFLSHPISHWLLPGSLPPAKQTTLIFFIYSHGFSPMTFCSRTVLPARIGCLGIYVCPNTCDQSFKIWSKSHCLLITLFQISSSQRFLPPLNTGGNFLSII